MAGSLVLFRECGLAEVGLQVEGAVHDDLISLITLEPGKRGGRPCIRDMRITVDDVLGYLASGMTTEELLVDFPYLTNRDVRACLAWAARRERHTTVLG